MTQQQFADKVGYEQSHISGMENGRFEDVRPFAYALAAAFELDANDVLADSGLIDRGSAEARKVRGKKALAHYDDLDDSGQELVDALIEKLIQLQLRGAAKHKPKRE